MSDDFYIKWEKNCEWGDLSSLNLDIWIKNDWSQLKPNTKETWRWLSIIVCCLVMCIYHMLLKWALIILSIFGNIKTRIGLTIF